MTQTKCPVCQTGVPVDRYLEAYTSSFNNQEYKLYQCPNCSLQWWEPLKIIPEFYEQEGIEAYELFHLGLREEIGPNHRAFLERFKDRPGKLLDVGCGNGVFLKEAQKYGFEVWGIDFDSKSIKVAQEKWGLKNTFAMSLDEFVEFAKERDLKFDYVTFFEVLEHQDNPKGFLEKVKTLLKDGGYIAGSVPNRESLLKKLERKGSYVDFPPHHFLRFSKESINNTLVLSGFNEVYISDIHYRTLGAVGQVLLMGGITAKFNTHIIKLIYGKKPQPKVLSNETIAFKDKIFVLLRAIRDVFFAPIGLVGKAVSQGGFLYFQAKL